ncbi:MAG: gfo/Idh/MocA family oxidoreductase [Planctomycetota bacterium]
MRSGSGHVSTGSRLRRPRSRTALPSSARTAAGTRRDCVQTAATGGSAWASPPGRRARAQSARTEASSSSPSRLVRSSIAIARPSSACSRAPVKCRAPASAATGCNAAEVEEIIAACEKHGVQFMDGVMFMHGTRLKRMREVVDADLGRIRHIATQFSFMSDDEFQRTNIRAHGGLEPLGCLGDLGWYCLRFTLWAMNYASPTMVTGCIHAETQQEADAPPVPLEFSGTLTFADGASASFYCSFSAAHAQWAMVSGTGGLLKVPDFVLPFFGEQTRFSVARSEFAQNVCRFDMHEGDISERLNEPSNNAPGSQEAGMFETFSRVVLSGNLDLHWPRISLLTQRVLDACLASAKQSGRAVEVLS